MTHLIDKAALVAEIERRIKAYQENFDKADNKIAKLFADGLIQGLESFLAFLDTFEVNEVEEKDLEKEINLWFDYGLPNNDELLDYIKETAKHFYELGLKTHKGE